MTQEMPTGPREGEPASSHLHRFLEERMAEVGVLGLGYVGLPLALAIHEAGFPVLGFDVDQEKVELLERGESYLAHHSSEQLATATRSERFAVTADAARLGEPDVLIICVPTPLDEHRTPDLSYVEATARAIAAVMRSGQLVVLESTTYPGTTDEVLRGILDEAGLRCGEEYFLAYSPEREDPGNQRFTTAEIPKLVSGVDPGSGALAVALYEQIVPQVVPVSSTRIAEAAKLTENIFRAVNIALVNELKMIFTRMEIDIWEVLDAAETKPFGFMRFDPGPGWGGHCIPIDPFYLAWQARAHGLTSHFIERAGEVNIQMPDYVVERLMQALNRQSKPLRGAKILLLGMAYKKNVGDIRESPALEIMRLLEAEGAEVAYHDPFVAELPPTRQHAEKAGLRSQTLTPELLAESDAVIIVTAHDAIDYELVKNHASLIVDTRGVFRPPQAHVVPA